MRFISVDPSSTATGWAVFDDEDLVAWGTIDLKKFTYATRFQAVNQALDQLVDRYGFHCVATEETKFAWGHDRQRNISGLQVVFKVIQEWAAGRKFRFFAWNVATWKNNVVGHVHATKGTTKENICQRFERVPRDLNEHEYDAIGIGVNMGGFLRRLRESREFAGTLVDNMEGKNRKALAKTGIEALVDEATGYQNIRPKDALEKRFKKHLKEG